MPAYAPTSSWWNGEQTAYSAGLSYFDDGHGGATMAPEPLGFVDPVSVVTAGSKLVSLFNSGAKVDQERQARVNYVLSAALNGNVLAGRFILAAPNNVSGNERSMWQNAATLLQQQNAKVYNEAVAQGPYWLVNSGDTPTNYPALRAALNSWALTNNPVSALTGTLGAAAAGAGVGAGIFSLPVLLGAGVLAYLAFRGRR